MADKDRSDWKEKKVEDYLKKQVAKLGGLSMKWTCPSFRGVPDQIVMYGGQLWFVELKTCKGALTPLQIKCHLMLAEQGQRVLTLHGADDVDRFINVLKVIEGQTNG